MSFALFRFEGPKGKEKRMLTQNEKREALEKIREAVVAASRIMTGAVEIGAKTEAKSSPRDLVTAYDKAVEEYLVGALGHAFPGAKFLGEEGHGAFSAEGLLWVCSASRLTSTISWRNSPRAYCSPPGSPE